MIVNIDTPKAWLVRGPARFAVLAVADAFPTGIARGENHAVKFPIDVEWGGWS